MDKKIVICDFDGTITKVDMIGEFLETFAHPDWHISEGQWRRGEIGSMECMSLQFSEIKNITYAQIMDFINSREVDDYFLEFYNLAKQKGLKVVIVSDGFDFFIKPILEKVGITDIEIYTNHMEFKDGKFIMEFPNVRKKCKKRAGTCKCSIVKDFKKKYDKVFYVGDGQSDFCVCKKSNVLFAKHHLKEYCLKKEIDHVDYKTFQEVIENPELGLLGV